VKHVYHRIVKAMAEVLSKRFASAILSTPMKRFRKYTPFEKKLAIPCSRIESLLRDRDVQVNAAFWRRRQNPHRIQERMLEWNIVDV
jgi:hypothetical protein